MEHFLPDMSENNNLLDIDTLITRVEVIKESIFSLSPYWSGFA